MVYGHSDRPYLLARDPHASFLFYEFQTVPEGGLRIRVPMFGVLIA